MEVNLSSEVYYFWTQAESNTWGVTVAESEDDTFSIIGEVTFPELSAITAPENEGGNGEGASWGVGFFPTYSSIPLLFIRGNLGWN